MFMNAETLMRLQEMKSLKKNWNGYGAEPIPNEIIEKVKNFVLHLKYEVEVFPTGNETIQIEASTNFGYFEIEFFENKSILFFASNDRNEIIEKAVNEKEAFEFINKFFYVSASKS